MSYSRINTANARLVFDNARNLLTDAGISLQKAVLSQFYIRTEIAITATATKYPVPVLQNNLQGGVQYNTSQLLALQDAFVVAEMGIFLAVPSSATDGSFKLCTFADPAVFTTAGAAASTETLYNGYINMMVNNNNIVPAWDIARCRVVNPTQGNVGVTAQTVFPQSQIDLSSDGFYPVEPNIIVGGGKNNIFTINLPAAIATIQANSRIVVVMRGVLAQNSTSVQ